MDPGYQRVYKIDNTMIQPGQPPSKSQIGPATLASQIKTALPGVEAIARLDEEFPPVKGRPGDAGSNDQVFAWADPDIFKMMPLPALAGDPATALEQPDTGVITRAAARKSFHRELPMGDSLLVQVTVPPPPGSGKDVLPSRLPASDDAARADRRKAVGRAASPYRVNFWNFRRCGMRLSAPRRRFLSFS